MEHSQPQRRIALVGSPNVGKSTLFNALTGLRQHTGNWPGKTVGLAMGEFTYGSETFTLVDLPGVYSLHPASREEEVTREYLLRGNADAVLVVADATSLHRSLALTLEVLDAVKLPAALCVNLMDEARRKGISLDLPALSQRLGLPVIATAGRSGEGLAALEHLLSTLPENKTAAQRVEVRAAPLQPDFDSEYYLARAAELAEGCTLQSDALVEALDRRLDRIFTSRITGIPAMLALFAALLYLTVSLANLPSALLSQLLFSFEEPLAALLSPLPPFWRGALVQGVYRTAAWVVGVMLPPMAIFFPLFTLLEDAGYLPRMAFNLDRCFKGAGAHGRQSLTMCMGLGCNACGVTGCRIIPGREERLIAMLTNAFVPCNGRFPLLIALAALFFAPNGAHGNLTAALAVLLLLLLSVGLTLLASRLLSATLLHAPRELFTLELPPYRPPKVGEVLLRSFRERTLFILGRAVGVAAPAGLVIYLAANVHLGTGSLLSWGARLLDPAGRFLGMDGMILLAFLLGFPANEIVLPILLMGYSAGGSLAEYESLVQVRAVLLENGWSGTTALCVMLFSLCHFPCGTTVVTLRRESGHWGWAVLGILLPTGFGVGLCALVHGASVVLG